MQSNLKIKLDLKKLNKLARTSPEKTYEALAKSSIQFLAWCNDGSPYEPAKPPIRTGVLRGSSTAFVANKLVAVQNQSAENALKSYDGKTNVCTFVWNTSYAKKMHEHVGNWGEKTLQDGNAGAKWLEKHLKADAQYFWLLFVKLLRKALNDL